jgi:hypothetical protein
MILGDEPLLSQGGSYHNCGVIGFFSFLYDCEIPISLEIVLESVIIQLGSPIKWILITVYHGLIFPQSEVHRHARMAMIHSSQGVSKAKLEWVLNYLNFISSPCISCACHNTTLSNPCDFLIGLGGACFTSIGRFSCFPPWTRRYNKLIISSARTVVRGGVIMRRLTCICTGIAKNA